jgi:hypothetical protein
VDLAVLGPWVVDPAYVDPLRHSAEHSWFVSTAAEYGLAPEAVQVVMRELSYGWSIRTALIRASVPPSQWNRVIAILQTLVHVSVIDRGRIGARARPG